MSDAHTPESFEPPFTLKGFDSSGIPLHIESAPLLSTETQKMIDTTWQGFRTRIESMGANKEDMKGFEKDFMKSLSCAQQLNEGGKVEGISYEFEPNELRYHRFEHTVYVVDRLLKILPGFLKTSKIELSDPTQWKRLQAIVHGAIFHEIGYLKQKKGDEVYGVQAELFFDHVNRGVEFTPKILQELGIGLQDGETDTDMYTFVKHMIRATDFNMYWTRNQVINGKDVVVPMDEQVKEDIGLTGETAKWGRVMEASDFLSAFSHPQNVPGNVVGLYGENMARMVKDKVVQTLDRETNGAIQRDVLGRIKYKKSEDPKNDFTTVMQIKFGKQTTPFELEHQPLYEFTASNFLSYYADKMEPYLVYADDWYTDAYPPDPKAVNEIRKNYRTNRERVDILQRLIDKPETDPLSTLEGAFTGTDLRRWVDGLKREQDWIATDFLPITRTWHQVDTDVLFGKGNLPNRLVTDQIREVLCAVRKENQSEALAKLLDRFRHKMQGENIASVYLCMSPEAYVGENSPFDTLAEAHTVIHNAFSIIESKKQPDEKILPLDQLPDLHFVWGVRREKDDLSKQVETINNAWNQKQIAGIAFLGKEEKPLATYNDFFDALDVQIPMTISIGQVNTDTPDIADVAAYKEQFMENVKYLSSLEIAQNRRVAWWGMHALNLLTDIEKRAVFSYLPAQTHLLVTDTYDKIVGFGSRDSSRHPRSIFLGNPQTIVSWGTGNGAFTTGASSVTLDMAHFLDNLSETEIASLIEQSGAHCIYTPQSTI